MSVFVVWRSNAPGACCGGGGGNGSEVVQKEEEVEEVGLVALFELLEQNSC